MSEENTGSTVGRLLVLTVLMIATLGFGLAGLCGAAFTVFGLSDMSSPGPENYAAAFLVVSVPSLLIGGGLAWLCGRALYKRMSRDDA